MQSAKRRVDVQGTCAASCLAGYVDDTVISGGYRDDTLVLECISPYACNKFVSVE